MIIVEDKKYQCSSSNNNFEKKLQYLPNYYIYIIVSNHYFVTVQYSMTDSIEVDLLSLASLTKQFELEQIH